MAKADPQQALLDKGLIAASAASSFLKIRMALDSGANPNFQDPSQFGWSALHFCCYFSANETPAERICKTLLQRGAMPDPIASDGTSPLLIAASVGSVEAVRMLVERRAKVDLADKVGMTPLMGAAARGAGDIVWALLEAGANADLKDMRGATAIDAAHARGFHDVAAMIEASMIRQSVVCATRKPKP